MQMFKAKWKNPTTSFCHIPLGQTIFWWLRMDLFSTSVEMDVHRFDMPKKVWRIFVQLNTKVEAFSCWSVDRLMHRCSAVYNLDYLEQVFTGIGNFKSFVPSTTSPSFPSAESPSTELKWNPMGLSKDPNSH